jgi:molybdopterin-guanine dinucleotide biosynthesis protein A
VAADIIGFVVAGGQSRRMGRDKALLPWGPTTLLDHAIARLRLLTGDVRILCGPEARYQDRGLAVIPDVVRDEGALGGVLSGLLALRDARGLFLAVDLPFASVPLLEALAVSAEGFDSSLSARSIRRPAWSRSAGGFSPATPR